jgi:predicted Zn-dependent protease
MVDRQHRIARLRKRHDAAPDSKVFAPLADLLGREGQVEEALSLLEDGLARHPDYLGGMVVLGRTLMDADRRDHGRKVLVRVLDMDPDNHVALGLLAEDALGQEVWDLAEPWLIKLVQLEGQDSRWKGLLLKTRNRLARQQGANQVAAAEGSLATMTLVDIYIEQGYLEKALAALQLMKDRDPTLPGLRAKRDQVLHLLDLKESSTDPALAGDDDATAATSSERRTQQRVRNKQQFHEWINGLSSEGEPRS